MSSSETYDKSISDEPSGQVFLNIPPGKWSDPHICSHVAISPTPHIIRHVSIDIDIAYRKLY